MLTRFVIEGSEETQPSSDSYVQSFVPSKKRTAALMSGIRMCTASAFFITPHLRRLNCVSLVWLRVGAIIVAQGFKFA